MSWSAFWESVPWWGWLLIVSAVWQLVELSYELRQLRSDVQSMHGTLMEIRDFLGHRSEDEDE